MKRISWTLDSFELPNFKIYNKDTHTSSGQIPIDVSSRPDNNTFFIGTIPSSSEKLLCYHISDGKYIVVSYNYSATRLLQDIIDTDVYEPKKVAEYEGENIKHENPTNIPVINETVTDVT